MKLSFVQSYNGMWFLLKWMYLNFVVLSASSFIVFPITCRPESSCWPPSIHSLSHHLGLKNLKKVLQTCMLMRQRTGAYFIQLMYCGHKQFISEGTTRVSYKSHKTGTSSLMSHFSLCLMFIWLTTFTHSFLFSLFQTYLHLTNSLSN